ncbi:uncharacterized protein LOC112904077 [Agrilus planipennis]|uniref:Uncharacterized protein LOC112904077 n=1 Tax=Agrilus planipennis TaxID=224129 RepID=A0A7F5R294_AGRPL|nr:uncharacterized protein LOC112904077 [Agrilus planipennis]
MGGKVVEETRQLGKEEKIEKNEDQEITQEEVEQVIKKLKKKKAAGEDKITNEAWIYGGKELQENLQGILNKIWNGDEDLPEEWKMGIIKPIFKKGDRHKPENYRGITLMNTGYKIYAEILRKRLEKELEDKKALGETQMGYRKNKGTIDAIYIVKTAIEEEIKKEKDYCRDNNIIPDTQAGFRKGLNSFDPVLKIQTEAISAMNSGGCTLAVALDFDTV